MKAHAFQIALPEAEQAFSAFAHEPYAVFLDSADRAHPAARYSFIARNPCEVLTAYGERVVIDRAGQSETQTGDPLEILAGRLQNLGAAAGNIHLPGLPPFCGGAAGFFGYDLARVYERLPGASRHDHNLPDMIVGIYTHVVAFDHHAGKAWIIVHAQDDAAAEKSCAEILQMIENARPPADYAPCTIEWILDTDAQGYARKVERVVDYIRAGDIFQVNISQRFEAEIQPGFDAYAHYLRLRAVNPAPFAGFMNCGSRMTLASASPERFLTVKGRHVETRPIKGTAPRGDTPESDRAIRDALAASAKDRAENTMIVDLLRNDLSKVCTAESVVVETLCATESFAGVHHLVSTVRGTLGPDHSPVDLLRACFPGGSITGAPKIRAMEIIEELEPSRRGPYCGSMGYTGFDGTMDLNIMIRTLVYQDGRIRFNAGGGITAQSDPAEEYQETLDKARAIFASFRA